MTQNEKIQQTTDLLRRLLKNEEDTVKLDLYWNLLKECMDKKAKNAEYVGDKWTQFLTEKLEFLSRRKEELKDIERKENSNRG
jgi:hypothetical protein